MTTSTKLFVAAVVFFAVSLSLWTSRSQINSLPAIPVSTEEQNSTLTRPVPRYEYPDVLSGSSKPSTNQYKNNVAVTRDEECETDPHQKIQTRESFSTYKNATKFLLHLDESLSAQSQFAICQFVSKDYAKHFAHSMQQCYACWSFWNQYPDRKPVLLLSSKLRDKFSGNAFLQGFFELLTEKGIEIMGAQEFREKSNDNNYPAVQMDVKGGYVISHAEKLRSSSPIIEYKGVRNIGILNRRKGYGRSILNTEALAAALQSAFDGVNVTIEYFEQATFQDQVHFFASNDIILSGHGAQLTGMPFSRPCTHLIEIFPHGYAIPEFFGSLATASSVLYSYMYLSEEDISQQDKDSSFGYRIGARAKNLCPDAKALVDHVQQRVEEQRQCFMKHQG